MLFDHEDEGDENESGNRLSEENFQNNFSSIVTSTGWAELGDVITVLGDLLSIALFLETKSASGNNESDETADTLDDPKDESESEISHPVSFSFLEQCG